MQNSKTFMIKGIRISRPILRENENGLGSFAVDTIADQLLCAQKSLSEAIYCANDPPAPFSTLQVSLNRSIEWRQSIMDPRTIQAPPGWRP